MGRFILSSVGTSYKELQTSLVFMSDVVRENDHRDVE